MSSNTSKFIENIIEMIQKRDIIHRNVTNTIAKNIDFVFEAIVEYLGENALFIEWDSIEATESLLVITASVPSPNSPQQKIISVGIPFNIIQQQNKDTVVEFFSQAAKMNGFDNTDVDSFDEVEENSRTSNHQSNVIKRVLH